MRDPFLQYKKDQKGSRTSICRDTAVPCPYGILNVFHIPGICCKLSFIRRTPPDTAVPFPYGRSPLINV
ncbi:hypothetical protein QT995_20540 [Microcoleus sp. S36b_A3]|uniref:hypothetical protein n=1 Tax=unclassified Microcoleus TaxID=2642155 RepID=UPI002FCF69F0